MPTAPSATLLIQTAFIGDVILMTALLEHLHHTEPATPVDVLVRRGNEGLLAGHPHVRQVLIWDKKHRKYAALWQLLRQIRANGYGRVVTLQRFASTGFLTAFSRAPERVGFAKNPLSRFFTRRVPHTIGDGTHEVARNLALLRSNEELRANNSSFPIPHSSLPKLYPSAADEATAAAFAAGEPYVCLAPTSVWFTKQFPEEKWLELLAALPAGLRVFLLGGPPDVAPCERLAAASGRANVTNLAGKMGLLASAALMRGAQMNYVNDSAPMHLCSAVGAPVTAVFCSTVPEFGFGPLSPVSFIVQTNEPLACKPCGLHGHGACPLGHFRCAYTIEVDQLLHSLNSVG
ncbi:glycosyltransferase family 9 protein [Hymenobacter sp. BT770]|uniref:glycosyltransferase family 9 protein n=1 Tax=Hymenobacter sp. BT770 TaxID=2886942 RepID=UPI001D1138CC|nr:glycosyltransferase family 9 protein [Hymenobacter sp. BT770]MCC3152838.1 glycosyltransferase family 9 protein [Hymenobacter sp. BT770]MDO3414913.1 glycosyltransferase family 9 protein [Hymenobacter sp. BT770]